MEDMDTEVKSPGAINRRTAIAMVVASIVLFGLDYNGTINIPDWVSVIPILMVYVHTAVYRLIFGANLAALQTHEGMMEATYAMSKKVEMNETATLDADRMLASIREDDERAGRA